MYNRRIFFALAILLLFLLSNTSPAAAKDEWTQVRSKNFNLVGNASEKEIRRVAAKLEQFRETFRSVFPNTRIDASIPTNVVVFKSNNSYKPFKPKRADGKVDNFVAGYFQAGEDANYITLSTEGTDAETYGTIFHEYVHFIINTHFGKSDVPPWFNEGLAEYYQTFEIEGDQNVKLGLIQYDHLQLLQENKLIPLETFFKISNYSLHENGDHSRSIFYAQAWALIHYLIQNGKSDGLEKFLALALKNIPSEQAFQNAFQMNYAQMEKELKSYVAKNKYQYSLLTFKEKLLFDDSMQTLRLSDAMTNAYLGDLLYHTNRADDAEEFLQRALSLEPDLSMANTTFGMVKVRQGKFDEAKKYLEKAISGDLKNHLAFYYYAYLLSREGRDEFGFVTSFPAEKSDKMRQLLKKAIEINPGFTESYELLAFVSLVNNEQLDEAVEYLRRALRVQPGNQKYSLRIAEIFLRQEKFQEAESIVTKIAATTDDPETKSRADNLAEQIGRMREFAERRQGSDAAYEAALANGRENGDSPVFVRRDSDGKPLTPEEIAKIDEEEQILSINQALRKPEESEEQVLGTLQKIECRNSAVFYTVKTETGSILLSSKDFQDLALVTFVAETTNVKVGCGADLSTIRSVLTYKPQIPAKNGVIGELNSISFVPENFRFMKAPKIRERTETESQESRAKPPPRLTDSADLEKLKREMMMQAMKDAMRVPRSGERRELGFIEKTECGKKGTFFYIKAGARTFKLTSDSPESLDIRAFTPDVEQVQFGCGMKSLDVPVVFTFTEEPNARDKSDGKLSALEFVPKAFKLEN